MGGSCIFEARQPVLVACLRRHGEGLQSGGSQQSIPSASPASIGSRTSGSTSGWHRCDRGTRTGSGAGVGGAGAGDPQRHRRDHVIDLDPPADDDAVAVGEQAAEAEAALQGSGEQSCTGRDYSSCDRWRRRGEVASDRDRAGGRGGSESASVTVATSRPIRARLLASLPRSPRANLSGLRGRVNRAPGVSRPSPLPDPEAPPDPERPAFEIADDLKSLRLPKRADRVLQTPVSRQSGSEGGTTLSPRSTIGPIAGVLATIVLALAPQAQARDSAKFKVLSISGTESFTRDVVYPPSDFGSCAFAMTERISFHSTKPGHRLCLHQQGARPRAGDLVVEAHLLRQLQRGRGPRQGDRVALGDLPADQLRGPGHGEDIPAATEELSPGGLQGRADPPHDPRDRGHVR